MAKDGVIVALPEEGVIVALHEAGQVIDHLDGTMAVAASLAA